MFHYSLVERLKPLLWVTLLLWGVHGYGAPRTVLAESCQWQRRIPSMGTVMRVVTVGPCFRQIQMSGLHQKIYDRLYYLDSTLSLYQPASALSQLNRRGKLVNPSGDLAKLIDISILHWKKTSGHFDVTVLPILKNAHLAFKETGHPPPLSMVKKLRLRIGSQQISHVGQTIELRDGGEITLDGIAKGYAVDELAKIVYAAGFDDFLIDFSGNLRLSGAGLNGNPWRVAIEVPNAPGLQPLTLDDTSIASSSRLIQNFNDGSWHHIIDPITLLPTVGRTFVSVAGPEATVCDLLSTALMTLTLQQAEALLRREYPAYRIVSFVTD